MNTSQFNCKICGTNDQNSFRKKKIKNKFYYEKICKKCEAVKALEYYHNNKQKVTEYQKKYLKENSDICKLKKKEYDRKRYARLKNHILAATKQYVKNNKIKINQNKKERRLSDPAYKLRHYISSRIRRVLKKSGSIKNSCLKYLNYSFIDLKNHLEKQFEPWMNWGNHGVYNSITWDDNDPTTWTWNLDHIIPQSDLPYFSMEEENFKKCWALDNLRPLSAKINVLEGASRCRHDSKRTSP